MGQRKNIFVIHGWEEADRYARITELLDTREAGIADYSVPPWRSIGGSFADVAASLRQRIKTATAVLVINDSRLHKRPFSGFEMEASVEEHKRIIVVQPHHDFSHPIPKVLDGHLYRVAPWRADVVGRAIRGEYPQDGRVFDISEKADRRGIVRALVLGTGAFSLAVLIKRTVDLRNLERELAADGIALDLKAPPQPTIGGSVATGAVVAGGLTYLLTRDLKASAWAAAGGAGIAAAWATSRRYKAVLHGSQQLRSLSVETADQDFK